MSSVMANDSMNRRRLDGMRDPRSARHPITNAVSVAMTVPQPAAPDRPDCNRQGGHARLAELPQHDFSLQFERDEDEEEEEGHHSVVDPLLQGPNSLTRTDLKTDRDLPEREECVSPRRVR
jgi:hypothetical protein